MSNGNNGNGNGVDLVLYYYPFSFYSQKVVMALHQMKIKYKPKIVDIHRGRQFASSFLSLNPKAEVPVLVDDVRVIPDSEKIIDYLQDNFASNGNPGVLPHDRELRTRVDQLHQTIHALQIEALSFGTVVFDDLGTHPKPPFTLPSNRKQMRDFLDKRPALLRTEINKNPMYADMLNKKLLEVEEETQLWNDRERYEGLLILFEKVLDECEAELTSHSEQTWWLCSPELSLADIDLSLLMYRLWQLGFERRMWERNRPHLKNYFARVQHLESFNRAITMNEGHQLADFFTNPVVLGVLGTTAIIAGGYFLWSKKGSDIGSALQSIFAEENKNQISSPQHKASVFNTGPGSSFSTGPRPSGRYGRAFN